MVPIATILLIHGCCLQLDFEFPFVKTLSYQDTKCIFGIEKKMEEIRNVTAICVKTKLKRIETRIEKKKKKSK